MLRITLAINADVIADYEVRNTTPGRKRAHYDVREIRNGRTGSAIVGIVHDRSRGADVLARRALDALIESRRVLGDQRNGRHSTTCAKLVRNAACTCGVEQ